jgi:hypothetical protein
MRQARVASRIVVLAGVVALTAVSAVPAKAQTIEPDRWFFRLAPYLWAVNLDATNTVGTPLGDVSVPIKVSFGDIFDLVDIAFSLHFEAGKNRWTGAADVTYIKLGQAVELGGDAPPGTEAGYEFVIAVGELWATYRVNPLSDSWAAELVGGVRYNRQDMDISITVGDPALGGGFDENWVDPIVGARYVTLFGRDKFLFNARGDVGGFGVGSDLTWNLQGGLGWRASRLIDVVLQYKYMDVDYENGESGTTDYFAFDGSEQGILLGVNFNF